MMPALGPHAGFIIASYAVFFVVVAGMILWILLDGHAQRRALAEMEARGVRRRSDPAAPERTKGTTTTDAAGVGTGAGTAA